MKTLVYLPKGYTDSERLHRTLGLWPISQIISQQPHPLLEAYAEPHSIPLFTKKPNFKLFGRHAPSLRDERILSMAELVVVFQEVGDPGAQYFIRNAGRLNLTCHAVHLGEQTGLLL